MIYDEAYRGWLINDGRDIVFSGRDGAGGFENEGQSLRVYNVATAQEPPDSLGVHDGLGVTGS